MLKIPRFLNTLKYLIFFVDFYCICFELLIFDCTFVTGY